MSAILVKSFVGQAERYFEKELTNERETYYSESGTNAGHWTGKGAEGLGLTGEIKKEDFSRMSRGINPATGKRFRRMTLNRTREENGEIKAVKEISGWDMVISAPKSVSIVGLIGKDERVRTAHIESVTDALERAEGQAQANLGGGKKEQTNNLIIGRFLHDSARPSRDGFVAPQLHDHCFIMNATLRDDGSLKPLESLELHRAQSYIKSVYYTGLADRLQNLGYAIEIDKETGAPEIVGISKEYREACSPRRAEILELAEKAGKNFRQLGLVNRREKVFDKNLIQEQHKGIDGLFNFQAERLVETARKNSKLPANDLAQTKEIKEVKEAKEAVTFALAKLSERESVFEPRSVLLEANKRGIGKTNVAAIEAELESRKSDEKVKTVILRDGREAAFLSLDEKIENELPQHIKSVQPKQTLRDEISAAKLSADSRTAVNTEFTKLSDEQKTAVREILAAKTGVMTLEGRAGVGKTKTLSFVGKMAEKADYEVLGLAPTTGAAQELEAAQIKSATLQKLLVAKDQPRERKRFYIVDESSFVSSRQMDKFFREAIKSGDRVLLVGDTRQHEGVEAGKPFARIQREELAAGAKIKTIRRQRKEADRETVKNLSEGKIVEAVRAMRERGQIVEIEDRRERHKSIVEAFAAAPEKSLVVAPRNSDRQEINAKIHEALKEAGKVGPEETEIKILRPRNELTGIEREYAGAYREGDVITYTRGSAEHKIAAKSLARVIKTDRDQNLLTVEVKDAKKPKETREITYNPKRLRGVSVWKEETIKVSMGERVQLRAPFETKAGKIANGSMLEVGKVTPEKINLTTDNGKTIKLDRWQPQAIDYGYAVTSHSSQGKTIDRVLIHAETSESKQILNERMAYVAVSRARDEALIFTDDAAKLAEKMARRTEKSEIARIKTEAVKNAPERTSAITPPSSLPTVEPTPKLEIKTPPAQEKTIAAGDKEKGKQETLIKEVLQMSRDSLAKQGIEPQPEAWKQWANAVINDLPKREASESQKRAVELLQKNAPPSERDNLQSKTSLEAMHLTLKLAPGDRRDAIVKGIFVRLEKKITLEREAAAIKEKGQAERGEPAKPAIESAKPEIKIAPPEIRETKKTTSAERNTGERIQPTSAPVKPAPKIRDYEAIGREKLIGELVAAANNEAQAWRGEELSYREQRRLTKMYREFGNIKPPEKQISDLKVLQDRFSEPLPMPKNLIEGNIMKFDNSTEAEKSASLRGQITRIDELLRREELEKAKTFGESDRYDVFGRTDSYFTQELHRGEINERDRSFSAIVSEAQKRGFVSQPEFGTPSSVQEQQRQQALFQMGIANSLQEQMNKSLDDQGIKIEPLASQIIAATVDSWANKPPTQAEINKVLQINQNIGYELTPQTKLEAQAYIYTHSNEEDRDRQSSSLASAATQKAEEIKLVREQARQEEREKSIEMEKHSEYEREDRNYDRGFSR